MTSPIARYLIAKQYILAKMKKGQNKAVKIALEYRALSI